jgi:hypothetical protein
VTTFICHHEGSSVKAENLRLISTFGFDGESECGYDFADVDETNADELETIRSKLSSGLNSAHGGSFTRVEITIAGRAMDGVR